MRVQIAIFFILTLLKLARFQCMPNYEYQDINNGLCMPCAYNCLTCYAPDYCLQCMDQYFLTSNNTCNLCLFGCSICLDSVSCSACNDGLYLTNDGSCSVCSTGVATCTIAIIQTCQDGYFLLSSICAGCLSNCKTCSDFVTCNECILTYYLSPAFTSCLPCSTNCLICTNGSSCSECKQGYTQNGTGCTIYNCSSFSQFCIACTINSCLTCSQGKYLQNGMCKQGGSLLCLQASGPYYTNCQTSNYGCPPYSSSQTDSSGTQLPVCLPQSATQLEQYIFSSNQNQNCNASCTQPTTQTFSYSTSQAYYSINYYINVRFYSNLISRNFTITLTNANGSSLVGTTQIIDISKQLNSFSQIDAHCYNCSFGQKIVTGSFSFSGGEYPTNLSIHDASGLFVVVESMFEHHICQVSHCSNCTSAVDCYACFSPYYLELTTCVSACDVGFYLYGRVCELQCPAGTYTLSSTYTCQICVSPCLTCSDSITCTTCLAGYFLEGSSCLTACTSTLLFANITSDACQSCPNPCVTCLVVNTTVTCLSCAEGYLHNGSSCVFLCPWGQFGNFINGNSQCTSCQSSCTQCYINSSICLSCSSGYLLLQTTCEALTSCPSSYYVNSTYNQCIGCHYPCSSCSSSATACNSCNKGSLYQSTCLNQCPQFYYPNYQDSQNITCQSCLLPCLTCLSATSCISCAVNFYLYQSLCLSSCPIYFYSQSLNNNCVACNPPCKSCKNATACLSCSTGYLDNITCTLTCNSTAYISSLFECILCPIPCLNCYSTSYCLACILPYLLYNNSCITNASCLNQTGYYPSYNLNSANTTSATCSPCTFPCVSCVNTSVTCMSCPTNYLYIPDMYKCVSSCPTSYYVSGFTCLLCSSNCYQCSNISTNCTVCSSGMYLYKANSSCLTSCPNNYYADDSTQICTICLPPCLTCYNAYLCSSCLTNILYSKQCVSSCPSSTYLDSPINTCVLCTNSCLTCISSPSKCLSCASGSYLYNQTCQSSCSNLYYANEYTRVCSSCASPCANCTSDSTCLSCVPSYYYFNYQCVTACSSSYYADVTTNSCVSCNLTICLTCIQNGNNCLTCNTNYYYYQTGCLKQCPNQTYADVVIGKCSNCPFPCSTCSNYTYCLTCLTTYYLFSNRCFSQCPIGYYSDNLSVCRLCGVNCQICTSSICLECTSGYFILNNSCLTTCPLRYYTGVQAITNYDSCLSCQTNCLNCSTYDYCVQCITPLIQFNGICLSSCPILYYAINQSSNYFCNQCSQYCTNCINDTYCLTCIGSYLYKNLCTVNCPTTTYPYQGISCLPCKSPCRDCIGDFTCTNCLSGYIYFHQYCVISCPSGIWYYPSNNTCNVDCPYNKYQANMTCYIGRCSPTMVTLNNYCLSQCSSGYYVSTSQQCILCSTNPSRCSKLFLADLEILQVDALTLSLYYNQKSELADIKDISIQIVDIDGNTILNNYTSYLITQYQINFQFDYRAIELVNITLTIPYVQSEESNQCISKNSFKIELPLYNDYSNYKINSFIIYIPLILIALLFVVTAINICNKSSHFAQILDFTQLVAVTLYLNIQYPPILEYFLSGFRLVLFSLAKNMINIVPYTFSPPKFIYYHTDTSLFRNQLIPFVLFLAIFAFFVIIIAIHTYDKTKFQSSVKVIRYRLLNDIFSICITPLFLFACQVLNAKILDLIVTAILGIIGVGYVIWIGYKIVQIKKISQLEGLLGDFQRTSSKLGLMYAPFAFIRRIVFTFSIGLAPFSPISTLTLLLVLTFLIMICVYFYQPFDNQYTDYVTIFMELSLTIYIICLIVFALNVSSPKNSNNLGILVVALITITVVIALGWLIYLTIVDIKNKGCCPKAKEQIEDLQKGKDDYSETKSQKNRKMDAQRDRRQKEAKQNKHKKHQAIEQDSAHQFVQRFNGKSDEIYSKTNENQQFKHWSEQSSQKQQPFSKKEVLLPQLLLKKDLQKREE